MATKKETAPIDASTEEKIKRAAHIVFHQKGFAATRTRDIAEEAGINLALLNYYFRTKEKLFEIVMFETISGFAQGISSVFNNENTTFEDKVEMLVSKYIDFVIVNPNVPLFILSEIRNRPEDLFEKVPIGKLVSGSVFVRQYQEKVAANEISNPNMMHFVMNLLGMVIFPFVGRPFISAIGRMDDSQFNQLMQERKKLIPAWLKMMFYAS